MGLFDSTGWPPTNYGVPTYNRNAKVHTVNLMPGDTLEIKEGPYTHRIDVTSIGLMTDAFDFVEYCAQCDQSLSYAQLRAAYEATKRLEPINATDNP